MNCPDCGGSRWLSRNEACPACSKPAPEDGYLAKEGEVRIENCTFGPAPEDERPKKRKLVLVCRECRKPWPGEDGCRCTSPEPQWTGGAAPGDEPTQYERETYEGRMICDAEEPDYCGSCSLEIHVEQMRDHKSWVHSSKKRWHAAYKKKHRPAPEDELDIVRADAFLSMLIDNLEQDLGVTLSPDDLSDVVDTASLLRRLKRERDEALETLAGMRPVLATSEQIEGQVARIRELEAEAASLKLTGNENAVNCDLHGEPIAFIPANGPCPACSLEAEVEREREAHATTDRIACETIRRRGKRIEELEAEVEGLRCEIASYKDTIRTLHRRLEKMRTERDEALETLEGMRPVLATSEQIEGQVARIRELEAELALCHEMGVGIELGVLKENAEADDRIEKLEAALDDYGLKYRDVCAEARELEAEKDAWRAATGLGNLTPEEAGDEIDKQDARIRELEAMIEPCRTSVDRCIELEAEVERLEKHIRGPLAEQAEAASELFDLRSTIEACSRRNETDADRIRELEDEIEQIRKDLGGLPDSKLSGPDGLAAATERGYREWEDIDQAMSDAGWGRDSEHTLLEMVEMLLADRKLARREGLEKALKTVEELRPSSSQRLIECSASDGMAITIARALRKLIEEERE